MREMKYLHLKEKDDCVSFLKHSSLVIMWLLSPRLSKTSAKVHKVQLCNEYLLCAQHTIIGHLC